jgi:hypothetical protein
MKSSEIRELNGAELQKIAGGFTTPPAGCGQGTFVPDSPFSTTGVMVYTCSYGTLTVSNNPTD